ncbi:MAG: hypothetical protein JNK23_10415 [Opitutaceae bacterium]|nr:hypothetical protein [Opitutaceae bacterium]
MIATAELPLKLPAPAHSPEEVAALVAVLREAGDWLTAKECAARMPDGTSDRDVRALASAACPQVVSFPGSKGYKLWTLCTVEEINHCIQAFESQGHDMIKRAVVYRQAYHRRFRGAPS